MRVLLLTHRRQSASFRIRWVRHLPAFEAAGHEVVVREIPERWRGRAATLDCARDFDLVVLQRRLLMTSDFRRLRRNARRLIYDFDDALCFREEAPHRSWTRERRFFRTVARSDVVIAGNRVLAGLARLRRPTVHVVPSGVDVGSYRGVPKLAEPTAVWIGQRATLRYLEPFAPAVRRAGFRLRIIADAFLPDAEAVPWSEESEADRIGECHVGLMPLPSDPFARGKCGYKMLQYFAAGIPCVASPVGAGRSIGSGTALLARDEGEWEAALRRLRTEPRLGEELGRRGRQLVEGRYDAPLVAERLLRLLGLQR